MTIIKINPKNKEILIKKEDYYEDRYGKKFKIINGVLQISEVNNYTNNFGYQWNKFDRTQFDNEKEALFHSERRFFNQTDWNSSELRGVNILEVGCGAGRFSRVVLEKTQANLYSIDYSDSVAVNYKNNGSMSINRFELFQANIYEMPFNDNEFDKVFCFGVLQHTPDFKASVKELIKKTKIGGEIVVDFYPINGWWTKIHAKYLFRFFTKRMNHNELLNIIEKNINWLILISKILNLLQLKIFTRFIPIVDLNTIPINVKEKSKYREWVILDTFDMLSPQYDNPKKIKEVAEMFEMFGTKVTFSGYVEYSKGFRAAVVRGIKQE